MFRWVLLSMLLVPGWAIQNLAAEVAPRPDEVLEQTSAPTGGDFILQSIDGPVSTRDLRGKVLLLYFGYTRCPDVCPTSLAYITQALHALSSDELDKVVSIFISLDPKRDTPQALADYLKFFHGQHIGLTGSTAEIAEVARRYGVEYNEVAVQGSALGYAVDHTSATYLIDRQGRLRFVLPHATSPAVLLEGLRYLLTETS